MCLPPPRLRRYARVLGLARHEATSLGAPALGTEHLLLGLVREGRESGARLLAGVDPDPLRALLPRAPWSPAAPPALTTRAAMAVGAAQREADRRGLPGLEVEGLLVAVLADQQSAAVAVLERLGIDVADLWSCAVVEVGRDAMPRRSVAG
ncbi:MAG TPA: Clp protease N-terminal domain-containing protein [Actinomycetospora sp.]|uniref:Clp protease N-terminal domain-containing protein n=1 Tax=Actinomycetospora sp. TaxID=1872135 RepID=UPI002F3FEF93